MKLHVVLISLLAGVGCATDPANTTSAGGGGGGDKTDSISPTLSGADANQLAQLLESSASSVGVRSISSLGSTFVSAYDVFCLGKNFQNRCFISSQDFEPAESRAEVDGTTATQIWSLLRKAGLQATTSNASDGTNGSKVLQAGTVSCTSEDSNSCTLDPSAPIPADNHTLDGADAQQLAQILTSDGASVDVAMIDSLTGAQFLMTFDLFCLGQDFHNRCFVSSQGIDPALSRADISDPNATIVWNLLKQAGFAVHISNASDGTAGMAVITGGTVRCTFDSGSAITHCALDGD